jgi:pilus assembly protein TadC
VVAVTLEWWLRRLEPASARRRRRRLAEDLPTAADLLAACLQAGSAPADAAAVVASAIGGPLAEELAAVVAVLRLGGDLADSWSRLAAEPTLLPLARTWARAVDTGAPLAAAMAQLADEQREETRWRAEAAARRAAITATAPLGLCFLPAFVLIGVVPAIAAIAAGLLA